MFFFLFTHSISFFLGAIVSYYLFKLKSSYEVVIEVKKKDSVGSISVAPSLKSSTEFALPSSSGSSLALQVERELIKGGSDREESRDSDKTRKRKVSRKRAPRDGESGDDQRASRHITHLNWTTGTPSAEHFTDKKILKVGYLEVKQNRPKFVKRWFVLKAGELLYYRSDHTESEKPLGRIPLFGCRVKKTDKHSFELSRDPTMKLLAPAVPLSVPEISVSPPKETLTGDLGRTTHVYFHGSSKEVGEWCDTLIENISLATPLEGVGSDTELPDLLLSEEDEETELAAHRRERKEVDDSSSDEEPTATASKPLRRSGEGIPRTLSNPGSSPRYPELTPQQRQAVDSFKKRVGDTNTDERTLFRFVKSQNYDIPKTAALWGQYLQWRKEIGVDNLQSFFPAIEKQIHKKLGWLGGYNKQGEPCILLFPGRYEPKEFTLESSIKFAVYIIEIAVSMMKPPIEKFCVIVDYSGFGMSNIDTSLVKEAIPILQNYYPERLGAMYLVNTSWAVKTIWNVIKPLLDPETKEKIQFIRETNGATLSKYFDPETLPTFAGGKGTYVPEGLSVGQEFMKAQH